MTFYSDPTARQYTTYTIWHSTVIVRYDNMHIYSAVILLYVMHNMIFYSDPTVRYNT
jgi:hypothetical protein